MKAACQEGDKKPILIYATDRAMEMPLVHLPPALETFTRFDNRLLKQELIEESPRDRKRSSNQTPASPPKRQERSNSMDSMASNRASVGDNESDVDISMTDGNPEMLDGGFREQNNNRPGTEMVQLAISRGPEGGADVEAKRDYIADWDNPEGTPV